MMHTGFPGAAPGPLRILAPVLTGLCLLNAGNSVTMISFSQRLSLGDLGPEAVRLALIGYPTGCLIGCLIAQPLIGRLGHRRTAMVLAGLAALASALTAALDASLPWFGTRALLGLAMVAMYVVCESWINLYAGARERGRFFSVYMVSMALSSLAGQLLLELFRLQPMQMFTLGTAIIVLGSLAFPACGGWAALPHDAAPAGTAPSRRTWHVLILAPLTLVAVFAAGMTNINIPALLPLYGSMRDGDAQASVSLIFMFSLGGLCAQIPAGWISDRLDRRRMLAVQALGCLILCGAIALLPQPALQLPLFFVYGCLCMTIYPVAIAWASSQLPAKDMVAASSGYLLVFSMGNILTPGIAATLMTEFGAQALFGILGLAALGILLTSVVALRRESAAGPAVP